MVTVLSSVLFGSLFAAGRYRHRLLCSSFDSDLGRHFPLQQINNKQVTQNMNPDSNTPDSNTPTQSWRDLPDKSAPLPRTQVVAFVKAVDTTPSKKTSKPMLTLTLQILAPASIVVAGINVAVAGRELKHWLVFGDNKSAYVDAETMAAPYLLNNSLDLPVGHPDIPKLIADVILSKAMSGVFIESEPEYEKDGAGNNVIDPMTGQAKVRRYNLRLKSVSTAVPLSTLGM